MPATEAPGRPEEACAKPRRQEPRPKPKPRKPGRSRSPPPGRPASAPRPGSRRSATASASRPGSSRGCREDREADHAAVDQALAADPQADPRGGRRRGPLSRRQVHPGPRRALRDLGGQGMPARRRHGEAGAGERPALRARDARTSTRRSSTAPDDAAALDLAPRDRARPLIDAATPPRARRSTFAEIRPWAGNDAAVTVLPGQPGAAAELRRSSRSTTARGRRRSSARSPRGRRRSRRPRAR